MAAKLTLRYRYEWVVTYGESRKLTNHTKRFATQAAAKAFMESWKAQSSKYGPQYWANDALIAHTK